MPNFSKFPAPNSLSVEEAIRAGKNRISHPSTAIAVGGSLLAILLPVCGLSWWCLLLFPFSVVCSYLYIQIATPAWRIWAYAGVRDIHHFQRCAELEWMLPRQGHLSDFGIMDVQQRHRLSELQKRFEEEVPFEDDPSVAEETDVASRRMQPFTNGSAAELVLSAEGIDVDGYGLVNWEDIYDVHIGTKQRARARVDVDWLLGDGADGEWEIGVGSREWFCMRCSEGFLEIPMSALEISVTALEHLLYVYRCRYEQTSQAMSCLTPHPDATHHRSNTRSLKPLYRTATIADIPHIQRVRHSVRENVLSHPSMVTDAHCADYLIRRGRGWVCEVAGEIVGFAIADLEDRNVWALFIHPYWEGRGIGKWLHRLMLDWYFAQTDTTLWLSTAPGTRAEGFYRRLGWKEAGVHGREQRFEMTKAAWTDTDLTTGGT